MKELNTLIATLASLMTIIIATLTPSAILLPRIELPPKVHELPSTWQVPALLICALVTGPKAGLVSAVAYLTIGLFYFPIFHGGGSTGYLLTPDMGYLLGFVPAVWVIGVLSETKGKSSVVYLTLYAIIGLLIIHLIGISNILLGALSSRWTTDFIELIYIYTIATLPSQLLLCPGVAIISKFLRLVLLTK
ncbi:biotin transporter BioY [Prochlorococcus marinus]|uniref:Biotin transporter n=1 Tax=Prochlorococcus marinus (strain MIT 9211) TaxID=93059 RepID=A9BAT9_PROM4|nr:biotin transporter BioY [Prochlorococcus marinus]ABX08951.1 conserved hypothetical protein [Prochlorococcus marinus str. MIT 9211]